MSCDTPGYVTVLVCQEELDFGVLVECVLLRGEGLPLKLEERGDPVRIVLVEAVGQLYEGVDVALSGDGYDGDTTVGGLGKSGSLGLGVDVRG